MHEEENKDEPAQDPDRLPNVIMNAEEVLPPETDEECQAAGMSLGQRISRAGKRMEEPKHTISFKDALKKFKSKEELYFTLSYRGKIDCVAVGAVGVPNPLRGRLRRPPPSIHLLTHLLPL